MSIRFELEPDNRNRPDEEILEDLRAVARRSSVESLTSNAYDLHGRFHSATVKRRFGGWNNALQAAGLKLVLEQNITSEALLTDIKRVATKLATDTLTYAQYNREGGFAWRTIKRLFGNWERAATAAEIAAGWNSNIQIDQLHENLERVWRALGRQPRLRDMTPPLSKYSGDTYKHRFGGWRKALETFVEAVNTERPANSASTEPAPSPTIDPTSRRPRTSRTVNWRLRFLTLRRDGFRCKTCGRSPANEPGVELEVDHVMAWSKGGETEIDNLQSLCERCNGGKSDLNFTEP